jgi:hypothetical protein
MTGPPPDDLKDWSKNALVREVRRLRAVTREMSRPVVEGDPREASTQDAVIDVAGDPHAIGGALFDARNATLLDSMDVLLVDSKADEDPIHMYLALRGRLNYSRDRVEHGYLFGADGAAALLSQVIGLAGRCASSGQAHAQAFAKQFQRDLDRRMTELP